MKLRSNHTYRSCRIKVGLTIGDPSGIGPAITLKALNKLKGKADFTVIGDSWVLDKAVGSESSVTSHRLQAAGIKFVDLKNVPRKDFTFGKIKKEFGRAAIEYLEKSLELVKDKEIDCLVTCPISKEAVNLAGFNFPGHTEYLAKKTGTNNFVMLLLNNELKISLVTGHIALKDVPCEITRENLHKNVILTYKSLKDLFLIKNPRIAVCGLNPHASDNGLMGKEESKIIKPVLDRLKNKMKYISGPISSDVAIFKAKEKEYDCVIAMYHDQALIPLKLSGKESGVNITLGLPFIRTSPLHGTAFDIAPGRLADPSSLIEAINLAIRCSQNLKKA